MATFASKDQAMMTKEEVAQVIAYCEENKISYKQRLTELGIDLWRDFGVVTKIILREGLRKYRKGLTGISIYNDYRQEDS